MQVRAGVNGGERESCSDQLTCTVPLFPGLEIVITPPHVHIAWHP
jgi:hypothetical protein